MAIGWRGSKSKEEMRKLALKKMEQRRMEIANKSSVARKPGPVKKPKPKKKKSFLDRLNLAR